MKFAKVLREKREALNLTQQELADQLHVTRQTLSRWENNLSFPNLDTLVELSNILELPLDNLLKGGNSTMVKQISSDVRDKERFKRYLITIGIIIGIILLCLGILGYGRMTQNEWIDRFNPFLKTQYGYAVLPAQVPKEKEAIVETDVNNKRAKKWVDVSQKVEAYVSDDPFGNGSWLKFYTGEYNKQQRWALVEHKGSYVSAIRLINKKQIPAMMREQTGNTYMPYQSKIEARNSKKIPWWPFN